MFSKSAISIDSSFKCFSSKFQFGDLPGCPGASLVAQLVKNLPANQETPVQFLGREDPLEQGKATHSGILGLPLWLVKNPPAVQEFNPWVEKLPWRRERLPTPVFWPGEFHRIYSPWDCKELDMTEQLSLHFT